MTTPNARCLASCLLPALLAGCAAAPSSPESDLTVSASDPRFRCEGRFDSSRPDAPVVIWQASRISIGFEGDTLALLFEDAQGQNFFSAEIDGSTRVIAVPGGTQPQSIELSGYGAGLHRLTLVKRSEAAAGTVRFGGVRLAPGGKARPTEPPGYKLAMEFIGDSITVGACNEDGDADQWDDRRTHNSALSYAALTAAAFSADHRNIAVSGMGVAAGWNEARAGGIWDRVYPSTASPRADLSAWTPNVLFVNLGENDDSFLRAHGLPFPDGFTAGYAALVRSVRSAYPRARIVLLLGGMNGGANSLPLRKAWDAAVSQLEAADQGVSHFVFKHWSPKHPRVADDRALADELIGWLRKQDFMRPWL